MKSSRMGLEGHAPRMEKMRSDKIFLLENMKKETALNT
jgi:hypothetical protein